ncbi:choline ABC transporter ATP-binding protein [Pontibacillus halophilus JSM 076056 = DSM 19796]|uniref:Quaternary amine transport ATP-binding protein n=1 Tax=Pontibacillus halophilus JSM 076056 = DSM 19796 TaxID=1385510 RepID=A0A0A5GLG1_9BACI|nr:ABC transporter ATP-binding protein [Pontibacillus halophilus]KGX92038.1 choline ABC transporter ATP-binding protein [Pontibacillus halophilus JSM 076056 = DSM 19796]
MIEFKDVSKTYPDGTQAIKNLNLTVQEGEILALIGPSGCGKTTTMKMINRLITPTEGNIYIQNEDIRDLNIHELRWNIGYVLQEIALFPHMTIEENIAVVPEMRRWKRREIKKRTEELMEMVGLEPETFMSRYPSELSGGQQQRVGVIRALAADPDIILMDEPFSALDPISREQLQSDIRDLQKKIKKTIVFVTHDMDEAMALGDRVCLMRDGEIVQLSTPQQLILQPNSDFVKSFIGERKSPWQTAIDVMLDKEDNAILSKQKVDQGGVPSVGIYFVKDENGQYIGAYVDGLASDITPLPNDTHLRKATTMFDEQGVSILPVVKENQLLGTLSYKSIVFHLQNQTKMENGVIHQ